MSINDNDALAGMMVNNEAKEAAREVVTHLVNEKAFRQLTAKAIGATTLPEAVIHVVNKPPGKGRLAKEHVFRDLEVYNTYEGQCDKDAPTLLNSIPTVSRAGKAALALQLWNGPDNSSAFQSHIRTIVTQQKSKEDATTADWHTVQTTEGAAIETCMPRDERVDEFYNQVYFTSMPRLNTWSIVMQCMLVFMVWLLPLGSLVSPIAMLVAPLVLIFLVRNTNGVGGLVSNGSRVMSGSSGDVVQNYVQVLQRLLAEQSSVWAPVAQSTWTVWLSRGFYLLASASVYFSAFWAQWQTSKRMVATCDDVRGRVVSVISYVAAAARLARATGAPTGALDKLREVAPEVFALADRPARFDGEYLTAYWKLTQNVSALTQLLRDVGQWDVACATARLVSSGAACFARFVPGATDKPVLRMRKMYHPTLAHKQKRIDNDITLGSLKGSATDGSVAAPHVVVTGPNRGGKSTALKTIGVNVLLAHTLGVCFARSARMTRLSTLETYINITDQAGLQSLFESEISRCVEYLHHIQRPPAERGASLLIMDEVFHSTNPTDGSVAAGVYIKQLHEQPGHMSLVTTHYHSLTKLAEEAPTVVKNMCIESYASPDDADTLVYTYKLRPGVNLTSSVMEILRARGLIPHTKAQ